MPPQPPFSCKIDLSHSFITFFLHPVRMKFFFVQQHIHSNLISYKRQTHTNPRRKQRKKKQFDRTPNPSPQHPSPRHDDRTEFRATATRKPHKHHPGNPPQHDTQQRASYPAKPDHTSLDNPVQVAHRDSAPAPHENTPPAARSSQ